MGRRWRAGSIAILLIVACCVLLLLPQVTVMIRYRERWPYWRVVEGLDYSSRAAFDQRSRRNGPRVNIEAAFTNEIVEAVSPIMSKNDWRSSPVEKRSAVDEEDTERFLQAIGSGSALFVKYGAYRGGTNTFAVVGLGSKAMYDFGKPAFECYWIPLSAVSSQENPTIENALRIKQGEAYPMLPDMGYGRVYSTVVVNCTFPDPVGTAADERGGQLVVYAMHGDGKDKPPVRFVALTENETAYDPARFEPPFAHDFAYCSPPLYGVIHPARVREWLAHHIRLFGPRSHFYLHDAGGITDEVWKVIEPWIKLGFVTVQDVVDQEMYDGYYHNHFLINNDCLHRTRFSALWTFFFDMDEYIYVSRDSSFHSLMTQDYANLTMLQINQVRMSDRFCHVPAQTDSRWAIEDLLYADKDSDFEKKAPKYAVQGRGVFATGMHRSQIELGHMQGEEGWAWWSNMRYYHYHNILSALKERNCYQYVNYTTAPIFQFQDQTLQLDTSMVYMATLAKEFHTVQIGQQ